METTPGMRALLPWWGIIQSSVGQRMSTAELWDTVRAAVEAEGLSLHGASGADMSRLRGIAAEQRNKMDVLGALSGNAALTSDVIARDVISRPTAEQALASEYIVRFEWTAIVDGEPQVSWKSSVWTGYLPATKDDLIAQLNDDGVRLADSGSGGATQHIGIGSVVVTAT